MVKAALHGGVTILKIAGQLQQLPLESLRGISWLPHSILIDTRLKHLPARDLTSCKLQNISSPSLGNSSVPSPTPLGTESLYQFLFLPPESESYFKEILNNEWLSLSTSNDSYARYKSMT
ncbi:hypothetical protein RRG08_066762 [Elysia crispata]|uniref:Uncharacterized protein n=1 Tax=Elysia crispata TaxID=231223 RepID=A0AAE1CK22_9GAST|nr:hypothetical protein RRG08_066762 [Elysia crispata]